MLAYSNAFELLTISCSREKFTMISKQFKSYNADALSVCGGNWLWCCTLITWDRQTFPHIELIQNTSVTAIMQRLKDVSLLCQFATWTFCTFGCFDTRTFRYLPERFATGRQRSSYSIANFQTGGETSREVYSETSWYRNVQRRETSKWRTGKLAKRPWIVAWKFQNRRNWKLALTRIPDPNRPTTWGPDPNRPMMCFVWVQYILIKLISLLMDSTFITFELTVFA